MGKNWSRYLHKTFLYRTENVIVEQIEELKDGKLRVYTDKRTLTIDQEKFIAEFLPVETSNSNGLVLYKGFDNDATTMNSLSALLLKNMQEIEKDEKFIPKADAMAKQAKLLIDLQAVKVKTIAAMKK